MLKFNCFIYAVSYTNVIKETAVYTESYLVTQTTALCRIYMLLLVPLLSLSCHQNVDCNTERSLHCAPKQVKNVCCEQRQFSELLKCE